MDTVTGVRGRGAIQRELPGVRRWRRVSRSAIATLSSEIVEAQLVGTRIQRASHSDGRQRWSVQKHRRSKTIALAAEALQQVSKQDAAAVSQHAQQSADAVAAAPSQHSFEAAPPDGQRRPSVATGSSSGTSRQSARSRCSEAFRRAHGISYPKRAFWGARLRWHRCTKDEIPEPGLSHTKTSLGSH
ncbi:hypothetical protein HPB51_009238 [Rhipicephalus microplus]|uniref:Uncharacterized protein n=1 Tax=Rhipicephalus microplus TaxID=6941 RepID=A0A9J6EZN0_RHIMP|nr:hypothetical protein HPB51_009238 [Rhipicephalus microplus]